MSLSGSQTSKSRPDPSFSFFLELSWFEWRKNFKRFEQARTQPTVQPSGRFDSDLQQAALFGGGLLEE